MQVLVRQMQLNGDPRMVRANVVARDGDRLKVRYLHDHPETVPSEVRASDTVPAMQVFGADTRATPVIRMYTDNRHALGFRQ